MTDKELKRLRWLPGEIRRLEEKLIDARERYAASQTHSVVMGSRPAEPYNVHPMVVKGPGSIAARANMEKIKDELAECRGELSRLNAFIDNIQDPQTRRIFELYYREGLTWQTVSMRLGHRSEYWARSNAKKYFEQNEKNDFGML